MLKKELTILFRKLKQDRIYSAINVLGLSLGITCAAVVLLMVMREYRVNHNYSKVNEIFRVSSVWKEKGMGIPITTLAPVGPLLTATYPEVVNANRTWGGWVVVSVDGRPFRENMVIADSNFFDMFDLAFLAGDPAAAFSDPNTIVITAELAEKCFGRRDVFGESISVQVWNGDGKRDYRITGVLEDLPRNSATHYDDDGFAVFISDKNLTDFLAPMAFESWESRYIVTFIELQKGVEASSMQARLSGFLDDHCPAEIRPNIELLLEPLTQIYLTDSNQARLKTIRGLVLFAVLMVVIAGINYVNLSTARFLQRAKEIGLRKVMGSQRMQLVRQFLTEAAAFAFLSLALSIGFVEIFIQVFQNSHAQDLDPAFFLKPQTLAFLIGFTGGVGLLAGCYPAFFLSSLNPIEAIKGGLRTGRAPELVRKGLVVIQFSAAIFLIISTTVIGRQLHFMMNRDLGFEKDSVLIIRSLPREWNIAGVQKQQVLKEELLKLPEITEATVSFDLPADYGSASVDLISPELPAGQTVTANTFRVDESYLSTFGLDLVSGRFFSLEAPGRDSAAVVLNQAAAAALQISSASGSMISLNSGQDLEVIGIVENFGFAPLQRMDKPMAFFSLYNSPIYRYLSLKMSTQNIAETVAKVGATWQTVFPDVPLITRFMDDVVQMQYAEILWARKVRRVSSFLAIFVASLGLLGLTAYSAEQRTKEIGIRKVLGATVTNVITHLSGHFLRLVILANLIAAPVAWWVMNKWLESFVDRIQMTWWMFALAGGLALAVAVLTISGQAIRAALANPVDSLRYE